MNKCTRADCNGDIVTEWNTRTYCLLCGRETGVPEPPPYDPDATKPFLGGFYRKRGKALKCTCGQRRSCRKHAGVGV